MRYVPDPFKNEFINIGVMLLARDGDFAGVRFARNWSRVRCIDPQADIEILDELESDIRAQLQSSPESRKSLIDRLQETLSTSLQISQPRALLSEFPQQDLEQLARTYLEGPRPKRDAKTGVRQRIVARMRDAFESAGVWKALNHQIKASSYTHRGDPLKIDCGYRSNGTVRMFHALSITTDSENAKVLAFTYPTLSAGVLRLENAKTDLTAIVEDDLNRDDDEIDFALNILQQNSINVATLSQMPELAERARVELRL